MAVRLERVVVVKELSFNMMTKKLILIFVRNPILGQVKTRLAASLGNEMALKIYQLLLSHTAKITDAVQSDKMVFYSESIVDNDIWDEKKYQKTIQTKGDLGRRMNKAFEQAFRLGYEQVVIIGSDLYSLKTKHLEKAFDQLNHHDVVIGPAKDGGYYLLGLKTKMPYLFSNKKWSQNTVLKDTISDLAGLSVCLLETLNDIDTISDLKQEPELIKKLNIDGKIY